MLKSIEKRFEVALPYDLLTPFLERIALLTVNPVSSPRRASMPRRTWHPKRVKISLSHVAHCVHQLFGPSHNTKWLGREIEILGILKLGVEMDCKMVM